MTGRANYRSMGGRISLGLEDEPHLAAEGDVSLRTACEYWKSRRIEVPADSNDIREVGWYGPHWGRRHELVLRMFGWPRGWRLANRVNLPRDTRTHDVALKAPNQLGIYDMSGKVWEWCQDVCTDDPDAVPVDGSAYAGPGDHNRRLRGGCHHNWNLHCTVDWRYGIEADAHDHCIGFRVVLA